VFGDSRRHALIPAMVPEPTTTAGPAESVEGRRDRGAHPGPLGSGQSAGRAELLEGAEKI
jgi:hypothetical protein